MLHGGNRVGQSVVGSENMIAASDGDGCVEFWWRDQESGRWQEDDSRICSDGSSPSSLAFCPKWGQLFIGMDDFVQVYELDGEDGLRPLQSLETGKRKTVEDLSLSADALLVSARDSAITSWWRCDGNETYWCQGEIISDSMNAFGVSVGQKGSVAVVATDSGVRVHTRLHVGHGWDDGELLDLPQEWSFVAGVAVHRHEGMVAVSVDGEVFVFDLRAGDWRLTGHLRAQDDGARDDYGSSLTWLSFHDNSDIGLAVGDPSRPDMGEEGVGAVELWQLGVKRQQWTLIDVAMVSPIRAGSGFGTSCTELGRSGLVVGSPGTNSLLVSTSLHLE